MQEKKSYLSIITVTKNNLAGLRRTADSILPLPHNCEWIIIDGCSQDGTQEFVETLSNTDSIIFISEKDTGIYSAMNKGVGLSRGEYLNFMNAGDSFVRETLLELTREERRDADVVVFDTIVTNHDDTHAYARAFPRDIHVIQQWDCVQHQSTLVRREVFDRVGLYSTRYTYLSDYDLFLRAYVQHAVTFKLVKQKKLALFRIDGASNDLKNARTIALEYKDIQLNHLGAFNRRLFVAYNMLYVCSYVPYGEYIVSMLRRVFLKKRS